MDLPAIGPASVNRVVLHIDFDYFFAQCEETRRPELKDRPLLVCVYSGRTSDSGVVSTANYVARKFGIRSGMAIRSAAKKLEDAGAAGVLLPLDRPFYTGISSEAMKLIEQCADVFEYRGLDECYLDVSSRSAGDYAKAEELAKLVKAQILDMVHLTCSVGIAPNKLLAKIASDINKPDGLTVIHPAAVVELVSPLDVDKIPGVGSKTSNTLRSLGIKTVRDLAKKDPIDLVHMFGVSLGSFLYRSSRGVDDEPVLGSGRQIEQLSHIITLPHDYSIESDFLPSLEKLCSEVFVRLTTENKAFRTISLQLILSDLRMLSKSKTLKTYSSSIDELCTSAHELLSDVLHDRLELKVRRLGVRLSDLQERSGQNKIVDFMQ